MSDLPSPLKSPTLTSTQVTGTALLPVDQVAQIVSSKVEPLERASCHSPVLLLRPMMSCLPSPLKSPTWTSSQVVFASQKPQRVVAKNPLRANDTHQVPVALSRP